MTKVRARDASNQGLQWRWRWFEGASKRQPAQQRPVGRGKLERLDETVLRDEVATLPETL